jgi:hypothetical protein
VGGEAPVTPVSSPNSSFLTFPTNRAITGPSRISLLDGFSGYNQVLVDPDDQEKTTFTTPWGTFMYVKMPFGLMNVGATFQRAMDIAFMDEIGRFIVIYMDDMTVYSNLMRNIYSISDEFLRS